MLYKPKHGCMWDPTVFWHEGSYYMISMYKTSQTAPDDYMWMAKSEDGVHWESVGPVLEDARGVYKMFLYRVGNELAINFGSSSKPDRKDNDTLRYYRTRDLKNWEYLGENHPDARWYHTNGRWDHMYVYQEEGVYYGYPVATPLPEQKSAWGLCKSTDGYTWECCPPPVIEWGDIPRINFLEIGGLEKIGNRYYLIGGYVGYAGNYGYSLYTFTAEHPEGPFVPDKEAFRLCGFDRMPGRVFIQNLAAFARGEKEELLISNAVIGEWMDLQNVWLLPMRKAVVDEKGHLRLGYWQGNDRLKGNEIPIRAEMQELLYADMVTEKEEKSMQFKPEERGCYASVSVTDAVQDSDMLFLLTEYLNLNQGIVMECTVQAESNPPYDEIHCAAAKWRPSSFGIYLEEEAEKNRGKGMAVTLEIGHRYKRHSYIEMIQLQDNIFTRQVVDTIGEGCAEVRGMDPGRAVKFRLLYRHRMFELYADDLLVQSFVHEGKPTGRIGICLQNARATIKDWKLYSMTVKDE